VGAVPSAITPKFHHLQIENDAKKTGEGVHVALTKKVVGGKCQKKKCGVMETQEAE